MMIYTDFVIYRKGVLTHIPICIGSVMTLKVNLRFENLVSKERYKTTNYYEEYLRGLRTL